MQIPRQRKPSIRMEMSPLIDCVFLLLIFFMLSSTFLTPQIRLQLPTAGLPPDRSQNDPVIVTVDSRGDVFLNHEPLSWDQLASRLQTMLAVAERKEVTLRCDEAAQHKHFMRALDAAKSCGAQQVHVAYQQQSSASASPTVPN
ncbi:MAG: biopolymer transporter ExbD [Pirellulaceae bacterium]|nr:biopolymer transporter ExbD [Pirellulaceae bacterium]